MRTHHASLALAAVAGLTATAAAQESVVYTYNFIETIAGTTTPITNPNGVLEPGESARLGITLRVSPDIGATTSYPAPPPPGTGIIAGLGSIFFDLDGTGGTQGTFTHIRRAAGWGLGGGGMVNSTGTGIDAADAGQFPLPGSTANSTNPIANIWSCVWTPSSYLVRAVNFLARDAAAAHPGQANGILVQYGLDPGGDPQYVPKYVPVAYGTGLNIPVVPAPAGLLLLAPGALAACRRRRR